MFVKLLINYDYVYLLNYKRKICVRGEIRNIMVLGEWSEPNDQLPKTERDEWVVWVH